MFKALANLFDCSENKFVLQPLREGEVSSFELHCRAEKAESAEDLLLISAEIFSELSKANREGKNYYRALATFLRHRILEFQFRYKPFVVAHYFLIIDHLFAPSKHAAEMSDLESILTINRGLVLAFVPSEISKNPVQADTRLYWFPCIKEVIRGLEYLAKLFSINENRIGSGRRFTLLISACSNLNNEEIEALWQFRCGLVHSGTLYNTSVKGEIYRFRVDVFEDQRLIFEPKEKLHHLEGNRYFVNLAKFQKLFEDAQRFLHQDMMNNIEKYAFSENYHEWIRTHWSLSYLPSKEEMGRDGAQPQMEPISPRVFEDNRKVTLHAQIVYENRRCLNTLKEKLRIRFRSKR